MLITSRELCERAFKLTKQKTLYVMGAFGAPLVSNSRFDNVQRYTTNYAYNKSPERLPKIMAVANTNPVTFGFDCCGVWYALLGGWNGDATKAYGGAKAPSSKGPVTWFGAGTNALSVLRDVSEDFSTIRRGEMVWLDGHVGIYQGEGYVMECTPAWKDGCQYTACGNIGEIHGYKTRKWAKHGKMILVDYRPEVGEQVHIKESATTWANGKPIPAWVKKSTLYLRRLEKNNTVALISTMKSLPIYTGRVHEEDLEGF